MGYNYIYNLNRFINLNTRCIKYDDKILKNLIDLNLSTKEIMIFMYIDAMMQALRN